MIKDITYYGSAIIFFFFFQIKALNGVITNVSKRYYKLRQVLQNVALLQITSLQLSQS